MADRAGESDGRPGAPDRRRSYAGAASATATPVIAVQVYLNLDDLPERLLAFLDAAAADNFFAGLPWFRTLLQAAGPSDDTHRIYMAESGGRPVAVLFARERQTAGRLKTHMLLGPSHGLNAPIYAPVLDRALGAAGLHAIVATIARGIPSFHVLRFDSLDGQSVEFAALAAAFRRHGMLIQRFRNFSNHYEDVRGQTFEDYLSRRSPQGRYSLGRHGRRLARSGLARFEVITGGPELKPALVDYALIDLQSWKEAEAYPDFIPTLAQTAASLGALRLGLLYIEEVPAAVQVWLVSAGRATLLRLHHNRDFAHLSPGTALTYEMLRRLFGAGDLCEIDFGPGDDAFKRKWLSQRRERVGLLAFNTRTAKGWLAAARHIGGHAAMTTARRARNALQRLVRREG